MRRGLLVERVQRAQRTARAERDAKHEQQARAGQLPTRMTYCIASRGNVGSIDSFANTVYRALNDVRGWPRAGVSVCGARARGGADCG